MLLNLKKFNWFKLFKCFETLALANLDVLNLFLLIILSTFKKYSISNVIQLKILIFQILEALNFMLFLKFESSKFPNALNFQNSQIKRVP